MGSNEILTEQLQAPPDWILALASGKSQDVGDDDSEIKERVILEGSRNDSLFKKGCRMRRSGLSQEEILSVLSDINREQCIPSLHGDEVTEISQNAARYEPATPSEEDGETSGIYSSLAEMLSADIPDVEEIVLGIGRGEVGMLVSVTNVGKSTLMMNLGLSLAAGESYLALAPEIPRPMRILYCDFEARDSKQRPYLVKMVSSIKNRDLAERNFIPLNTPVLNDEQMSLSNQAHMKYITDYAKKHNVDLIIVDTAGAAFDLHDENNNAEVTKSALKPMIRMARKANTAVLFCHHAGKPGESSTSEKAYSGRGASAWGGLSRAVFLLTRDKKKGKDYVVLECAKVKGQDFEPMLLKLNRDTAWFEVCAERPEIEQDLTAQEIANFVNSKGDCKRKEILEHFTVRASAETIDRRLEDAVKYGLIDKPQRGLFRSKNEAANDNNPTEKLSDSEGK